MSILPTERNAEFGVFRGALELKPFCNNKPTVGFNPSTVLAKALIFVSKPIFPCKFSPMLHTLKIPQNLHHAALGGTLQILKKKIFTEHAYALWRSTYLFRHAYFLHLYSVIQ
jgi:hypothetical protein